MNEWKGPWKCDRCGMIVAIRMTIHYIAIEHDGMFHAGPQCFGKLVPYDRRAPDPEKQEAVEALERVVRWYNDERTWSSTAEIFEGAEALLRRDKGQEEDAAFRVWQNKIREAGGKWKRNVEPAPFGAATKESRDERR